jgi:hypothetical protein
MLATFTECLAGGDLRFYNNATSGLILSVSPGMKEARNMTEALTLQTIDVTIM